METSPAGFISAWLLAFILVVAVFCWFRLGQINTTLSAGFNTTNLSLGSLQRTVYDGLIAK